MVGFSLQCKFPQEKTKQYFNSMRLVTCSDMFNLIFWFHPPKK